MYQIADLRLNVHIHLIYRMTKGTDRSPNGFDFRVAFLDFGASEGCMNGGSFAVRSSGLQEY